MRTSLRLLPFVIPVAGLSSPVVAPAATRPVFPQISSVAPLRLTVGDLLTVKGSGFRPGPGRTTVVFQRSGKPAIFVRAATASRTRLTVRVPGKLLVAMDKDERGSVVATRFRLRVLSFRFGRRYTAAKLSPIVTPKRLVAPVGSLEPVSGTPPVAAVALSPEARCQLDAAASAASDADGDSLSNALERSLGTDPCKADTDGDGVPDGYEYQAAKDLNGRAVPYAGRKPWANPLDGSDAKYDYDGDGLTMAEEHRLWAFSGGRFNPDGTLPYYSDGRQSTGGSVPVTSPAQAQLDLDGDGNLSDDERDADGDRLSNIVELKLSGTQAWWAGVYKDEKPYTARAFGELDPTLTDTDGDEVPDGLDDQDNDGYDNITEMQRGRGRSGLRVQPFNPCLPNPHSLTCGRYLPPTGAWPPFDGSAKPFDGVTGSIIPFRWPDLSTADAALAWDGNGGPQGS